MVFRTSARVIRRLVNRLTSSQKRRFRALMRNYIQVWFISLQDDLHNQFNSQFVNSNNEVGPWIEANMPPGGFSEVATWYLHLNKYNVTFLLNAALGIGGIGSIPFSNTSFFTQDRSAAKDFNVDSDTFNMDLSDPASLQAARVAKERLLDK